MKLLNKRLIFGTILGVIVIIMFLLVADMKQVLLAIKDMPGRYLFLACLLTFMSYILRLVKWHVFSKDAKFQMSFKENTVIFFIGLMMSITPGKAGELIKALILKNRAGIAYTSSIPVIMYDRLTDLLAMLALVGIGLLVYPFGLVPLLITAGLLCLFFILIQRRTIVANIINIVTKPKFLQRFHSIFTQFYEQTLHLMRFKMLSFAFVISFLAWFLECVSLYVIIYAFGIDVSLLASILTFSLGTLAGALSMIPGGLGAAEGSITGLLMYFGVGGSLAITISLIIRFVTLWFGVLIGFIIFIIFRKTFLATHNEQEV